tara:strand:- start:30 stop:836 length:807 start_codon:yes stop_codon:yes gene_type:complete
VSALYTNDNLIDAARTMLAEARAMDPIDNNRIALYRQFKNFVDFIKGSDYRYGWNAPDVYKQEYEALNHVLGLVDPKLTPISLSEEIFDVYKERIRGLFNKASTQKSNDEQSPAYIYCALLGWEHSAMKHWAVTQHSSRVLNTNPEYKSQVDGEAKGYGNEIGSFVRKRKSSTASFMASVVGLDKDKFEQIIKTAAYNEAMEIWDYLSKRNSDAYDDDRVSRLEMFLGLAGYEKGGKDEIPQDFLDVLRPGLTAAEYDQITCRHNIIF